MNLQDFGIDPSTLTDGEAATLAGMILGARDLPHVIWLRADVEMIVEEEGYELSPSQHESIVDTAWERSKRGLSDCSDSDWGLIRDHVYDAISALDAAS